MLIKMVELLNKILVKVWVKLLMIKIQHLCVNILYYSVLDTFRAYDCDNDNRISRKEFVQII